MFSIASQINANHFILLLLLIISICALIAYANAKQNLYKKLRTISIAYIFITISSIGFQHQFGLNILGISFGYNSNSEVVEKSPISYPSVVIKLLSAVKRAF